MRNFALASMLLASALAWRSADALTIYRCGALYSQTPCGGAERVDADDGRSAGEVADARDRAARELRQADRMEHDRLRQESAFRPALASGFDSRSASTVLPHAVPKTSRKKQRRLARAAAADDAVGPTPTTRSRAFATAP